MKQSFTCVPCFAIHKELTTFILPLIMGDGLVFVFILIITRNIRDLRKIKGTFRVSASDYKSFIITFLVAFTVVVSNKQALVGETQEFTQTPVI